MRDTAQVVVGILWVALLVVATIWGTTLIRLVARALGGHLRSSDTRSLWRRFWLSLGLVIAVALIATGIGIAFLGNPKR